MEVKTVLTSNLETRGFTSTIESFEAQRHLLSDTAKKVFVLSFRRENLSSVNVGSHRETLTASHLNFPISNSYLLF